MITFGIITKVFGNEETKGFLRKLIDSIHLQKVPECQIIVVGDYKEDGVETIDFPEDLNGTSYITRKQNLIIDKSRYENIVFLRDYNLLWNTWFRGLEKFGYDWTVLMNPILQITGERYRDLLHWDMPGVGNTWVQREIWNGSDGRMTMGGPHLPPYSDFDQRFSYINGGYFCAKKSFMEKVKWNPDLQWGQAEDVEISLRMRWEPDFDYKFNPYSIVELQKQKDRILPVIPNEYFGSFKYVMSKYRNSE